MIRPAVIIPLVIIFALGVRASYIQEARTLSDFGTLAPGMDEYNYDRLAFSLARGGWISSPALPNSLPLYPYFLAAIYMVFGRDLTLIRLTQCLLGALSCGLVYLVGRRTVGEGAGLLGAIALGVYGMAVYHALLIVPATLAVFMSLAALAFWSDGDRDWGFWRCLGGGILLGLASLTAAANLIFAALVYIFILPRKERGQYLSRAAGTVLGIAVVLGPIALRNARLSGGWVPLTAHGGVNFYIGNNPEANGGYRTPIFLTPSASGIISDSRAIAERETGRRRGPAGVSSFWFAKGLKFIRASPAAAVGLALKKLGLLLSHWEYCDVGGMSLGQQTTVRVFGLPLLPFSLLAPWAILGLLFNLFRRRRVGDNPTFPPDGRGEAGPPRRGPGPPAPMEPHGQSPWYLHEIPAFAKASAGYPPHVFSDIRRSRLCAFIHPDSHRGGLLRRRITGAQPEDGVHNGQRQGALILYLYLAAHVGGIVIYYYQARARLLLVPVLVLFGASSFLTVAGWIAAGRYRRAAIALFGLGALYIAVTSRPWVDMRSEVNLLLMSARDEAGKGNWREALSQTGKALELKPDLGGAFLIAGDVYFERGDLEQAMVRYVMARFLEPEDPTPYLKLGNLHLRRGELKPALRKAEAALRIDPLSSEAHALLAVIYAREGYPEKAAAEERRSLRLNPAAFREGILSPPKAE